MLTMRRSATHWLFVLLALLMALFLFACSSEDASSNNAAGEGNTRVVKDSDGVEVTVPERPQRVITFSEPTLDSVLALGVKPAGTVAGRGLTTVPAYLQERAGDTPIVGSVGQPNFEAIGALNPDMILVDGTSVNNNPDVMAALGEIAPTVMTGYAGGDWRKNFAIVADAMNMNEEGKKVLEEHDRLVAETSAKLEPFKDKTFSIVRWQGNGASLILKELPAGQSLEELGLKRPANQDKFGGGHSEPVSNENLGDIDADYIFFGTLGGSSVGNPNAGGNADSNAAGASLDEARQVPGFDQLTAVRDNHVIPVEGSAWTSTGGPLLVQKIISDVDTLLVQNPAMQP
ncbi:iron-siderophore ABC transporter substrate-binding protein [Corynebacterium pelargi]|uniref:Putative siderophore-binding lipoprotein YfiY n=1 Tax=Corynebacterium pelargi TaxID=1471400 RepID=A0A410WB17_9CORY|nr:iron-siderophore ABC transporter substrate-binding protein [Corynebacterium pelargi]QAU53145.1 putative siderophore-binding lipoprotein YfiY precursor [Corynebacterium pelargi]GGG74587.1 ABC transporter substrate-binding protein [Corynebacterium pelargi]